MSKKMIIGMIHFGDLLGDLNTVIRKALCDLRALQDGGVDGILMENWKENSVGEWVSAQTTKNMTSVVNHLVKEIRVPFGFNVLNNDYKVAFGLAKQFGAAFVELDVFVDEVESRFETNLVAKTHPFVIKPNPKQIMKSATAPLWAFVQPKHYKMLDPEKTIEDSALQAIEFGASAIIVTKATGVAPTIKLVERVKKVSGGIPVGVGSGITDDNAGELLDVADFAVVGSYFKKDGVIDNMVDIKRVRRLLDKVKRIR